MASKILNTRIQLKYDTEANWTSQNPVLLSGEMAVSSDKNGQFKTGNGTATWSQLSYNQIPWTSVTGRPSSMKNPSALTVQFNGVTNKTYDGSSAQTVNITPGAIGAAPTTHSHNYMDLTKSTSRHTAGSLSLLDAAKIDVGRACRTAFLPASGIAVEYTTDGSTWIDYGLTDTAKQGLCSMNRATQIQLGKGAVQKEGNGVRITLIPVDRYSSVDQFYCWFNTSGADCTCSIESSTIGSKTTFTSILTDVKVAGWSGNNILTLPGSTFGGSSSQTSNVYAYRITFKIKKISTTYTSAPSVTDLRFYGVNAWSIANSMMLSDHIYSWDSSQNVKFPASLNATGGLQESGITLSAKYQPKGSYANASHTHPKSQITDFPTSLKNPTALTISLNGTSQGAYDGSTAKSFNITAASIGAATTSHTHNYAGSSSSGGAANSATKLATARKIGTASFDGTADISLDEYTASVPASAWSSAYPFTATVSVSGIKAAKNYVLSKSNYSAKTLADVKTYEKNIGYIFWAEPADGSVKFYAKKKPTIDFAIQLKEVL